LVKLNFFMILYLYSLKRTNGKSFGISSKRPGYKVEDPWV